ncbi:hypothetical protein LCGC14_1876230, partial [marine sediment metagenome]
MPEEPNGKIIPSFTESEKKIISKLIYFRDKIHASHPFKEITVRDMDGSFYTYIDGESWNLAKNQIDYKLRGEIRNIKEIMGKLVSIFTFLKLEDKFKEWLSSSEPIKINGYQISRDKLIREFTEDSNEFKNNILTGLKNQYYNISSITGNLNTSFSDIGIYIFLTEDQIQKTEEIKGYFEITNKKVNAMVKIDVEKESLEKIKILEDLEILHNQLEDFNLK